MADSGQASVDYGKPTRFDHGGYQGKVATGARFDGKLLAIAHRTLPLGTKVEVTYRGHSAIAVVNDRGPCLSSYCQHHAPARVLARVMDMTPAMAKRLRFPGTGLVTFRVVDGPAKDMARLPQESAPAPAVLASADPNAPTSEGSALEAGGMPVDLPAVTVLPKVNPDILTKRTHQKVGLLPHPAGCPARAFCGCGAALEVFGRNIRDLWLAANWFRFPRASPAPGMVAVRRHHVFVIREVRGHGTVLAYDANSGGHQTRLHVRSLAGFTVVDPHHSRRALL